MSTRTTDRTPLAAPSRRTTSRDGAQRRTTTSRDGAAARAARVVIGAIAGAVAGMMMAMGR